MLWKSEIRYECSSEDEYEEFTQQVKARRDGRGRGQGRLVRAAAGTGKFYLIVFTYLCAYENLQVAVVIDAIAAMFRSAL